MNHRSTQIQKPGLTGGRYLRPGSPMDDDGLSVESVIRAGWCPDCKERLRECECAAESKELDFGE